MRYMRPTALLAASLAFCVAGTLPDAVAQKAPVPYRLVTTIELPGEKGGASGAAAFDPDTRTIWLPHAPSHSLMVIETATNSLRQTIDGIDSPSGVSFSEHYAFVADAANGAAVVIGKRSLEKATTLRPVGAQPDGTYFDSREGALWVAAEDGEMTVFKAVGRGGFKRLAGLKLRPASADAKSGTGLFLASRDRLYQPLGAQIAVIDSKSRKVERSWTIETRGQIVSLAYDTKTDRVLAACEAGMVVWWTPRPAAPSGSCRSRARPALFRATPP